MPQKSLILSLALLSEPVHAADADVDQHPVIQNDIVVTAPFVRSRFTLPTAIGVLSGDDLTRDMRGSIGETLASQPGVSSTYFGPGASRPILRGMQGDRVRILTDGIGSFDVSNTSVDHAVAINPLLAERVEVVRGPASLLYGSSAIGGVVNVLDTRIPRYLPTEAFHIDAIGTYASAAKEGSGGASVNMPIGKTGLVVHADGSYLDTGNLRTGGYIFSKDLRAEAQAVGGQVAEDAEARGRMPNTNVRTWDVAGGLTWFAPSGGSFGFAVSHLASNYGIPNSLDLEDEHDHEHDHDGDHDAEEGHGHEEDVRIDMRQTRVDARAEIPLGDGLFQQAKFRFGWADYRHDEIEQSGEIGTSFFNNSLEARGELVQNRRGGWSGASGVQYMSRDFDARGEEAYIPRNSTQQSGIFTLQQFDFGRMTAEVGGRYEHSGITASSIGFSRDFDAFSVSGGISMPVTEGLRFSVNLSRSERAPSAEELLSDGAHLATRSFEVGNHDLGKEKSLGAEAVLRGKGAGYRFELSGYYTHFDDFIYFGRTGEESDGLPVHRAGQRDARFWGFEAEGAVTIFRAGNTSFDVTGLADYVNATLLDGGGPAPRIPPMRFIGGVEASGGTIGGRIEVEHTLKQDRLADFETETGAFTLVNASIDLHPSWLDEHSVLMVSANNIFDVEARRHSSYLKDIAPLPGRDIRVTLRISI